MDNPAWQKLLWLIHHKKEGKKDKQSFNWRVNIARCITSSQQNVPFWILLATIRWVSGSSRNGLAVGSIQRLSFWHWQENCGQLAKTLKAGDTRRWAMLTVSSHMLGRYSISWKWSKTAKSCWIMKSGSCALYLQAWHRKRKNVIGKLVAGYQVFTGHEDKERVIFDFYNGVLGSSMNSEVTINLDELDIASHIWPPWKSP